MGNEQDPFARELIETQFVRGGVLVRLVVHRIHGAILPR